MRLLLLLAWFALFFNVIYANVISNLQRVEINKIKAQLVLLEGPREKVSVNRDIESARRAPQPNDMTVPQWHAER